MPNLDQVLRNLEKSGRGDRIDLVRDVLKGDAPHRIAVPVGVERAEAKKAPNGADYHIRITASSGGVARDGGVVPLSAWENGGLRNFELNPVIQFAHDYRSPPIAKSVFNELSQVDRGLIEYWLFHEETDNSKLMRILYDRGFMRAASVGFIIHEIYFPTEKEAEGIQKELGTQEDIWWVAKRAELLETSAVPVPADPNALMGVQRALASARAAGIEITPLQRSIDQLQKRCEVGDSQACEELSMPPEQVEQTAEATTPDLAGQIAEGVRAALEPVIQRLDALDAWREARENAEAEAAAVVETPPATPPADPAEAERGTEGDDMFVIEVKDGETEEQAIAREVDAIVAKKSGAPIPTAQNSK